MEQAKELMNSVSKASSDAVEELTDMASDVTSGVVNTVSRIANDTMGSVTDVASNATLVIQNNVASTPLTTETKNTTSNISYKDAVGNFFEYKSRYEKKYFTWKKDRKNKNDGNRDPYVPKCLECNGSGGMSFEITSKKLIAKCKSSPQCKFHININRMVVEQLESLFSEAVTFQNSEKDQLIIQKNKMVFYNHTPDEKDTDETIENIEYFNDEAINYMNQKNKAIHGTPEEVAKYEALEREYKEILAKMQKAKDSIVTGEQTHTFYKDLAEIYRTELLPTVEAMRVYRDRYRFTPISKMEERSKDTRKIRYNTHMMEIDNTTSEQPDFSSPEILYRLN